VKQQITSKGHMPGSPVSISVRVQQTITVEEADVCHPAMFEAEFDEAQGPRKPRQSALLA
jgi:hypothetical protein